MILEKQLGEDINKFKAALSSSNKRVLELSDDMSHLKELLLLKKAHGNLMEAVSDVISEKLDKGPLHEMRALYMPRSVIEAKHMKIDDKFRKQAEEYKFLNDCRKKMDMQWETLNDLFVDREGYKKQV